MEEKAKKILELLQTQCVRREYCSSDILSKTIARMDADAATNAAAAEEILASLIKDNFVSDRRYCEAFAREKSSLSGWGPVKIRFALSAKRIPQETIDAAMEEIDTDKADRKLESLLAAKWKSLEGDRDARLKLIKYALSRGYTYEAIKDMVGKITSQSASDDI